MRIGRPFASFIGATVAMLILSQAAEADILTGLPDKMRVDVDPGIAVRAKTVGELRKVAAWPDNLAILTPRERDSSSTLKVSKANVTTRVSPKQ